MTRSFPVSLATTLLAGLPVLASAQSFDFTVDLTASSPTFIRPGRSSGDFAYYLIPATIGDAANFSMIASGGTHPDAYMYLYSNFDPTDPTTGVVLSDDDGGAGLLPAISPALGDVLSAAGDYDIVITSYSASTYGTLTFTVTGLVFNLPGSDTGPEPIDFARDLELQAGQAVTQASALRTSTIANALRGVGVVGAAARPVETARGFTFPAVQAPRIWGTVTHTELNDDLSGSVSGLVAGGDLQLSNGMTVGAAVSGERISTKTDQSSAKGTAVHLQPYLATQLGPVDALLSLSVGWLNFSDYDSNGTEGDAEGYSAELGARFSRDFALPHALTATPYAQMTAGWVDMSYGGGLSSVSDTTFDYQTLALGAEVSRAVQFGTLQAGSRVFGRGEVNWTVVNTPDSSFAVDSIEENDTTGTVAVGVDLSLGQGHQVRIEAVASDIADSTSTPDQGITLGYSRLF